MNVRERDLVKRMLDRITTPVVSGVVYEEKDGKLHRREVNSMGECSRLLASADYKAGWNACAEQVREYMAELDRKRSLRGGRR